MRRLHSVFVLVAVVSVAMLPSFAGSMPSERVLQETLDVAPGGSLRVDVPDADIEVAVGSGGGVRVDVTLASREMDWARERYEEMDFSVSASGGQVVIEADRVRQNWRDWPRNAGFQLIVSIEIPRELDVDLRTGDGDVVVDALDGELQVRTSDGDIRIGKVHGPRARIFTSDGDIRVDELVAESVEVRTSDGDVDIERLEGSRLEVQTSDGEISLDVVSGQLRASTSDGDIRVGFDRVDDTTLKTGDGDIVLLADGSLRADLDLRGEDVVIRGTHGFDGVQDEGMAQGSLNGGGPTVRATARDGSVQVRAR